MRAGQVKPESSSQEPVQPELWERGTTPAGSLPPTHGQRSQFWLRKACDLVAVLDRCQAQWGLPSHLRTSPRAEPGHRDVSGPQRSESWSFLLDQGYQRVGGHQMPPLLLFLSGIFLFVCLAIIPFFPPSLGVGCAGDKVITLPPESGLRGPADLSEHLSASTPMWGVSLWSRERWGGGGHEGQTLGLRALEEAVERGVAAAVGPPDTPTHPFPYDCLPLALQPRGLWVLGSLGADGGQGPFPHLGDTSPGPRQPPMSWWFLQTHPWPQPTCRTGRSGAVPEPAPSAVERRNQSTYLSTRVGRVNV